MILTHKWTFEGAEIPYHVLDWRSFESPRVCRASLFADVQSAAQAIDSTEFEIRFDTWFWTCMQFFAQSLDLSKPTVSPTFIKDATAVYDSYHRDPINHGVTDEKKTNSCHPRTSRRSCRIKFTWDPEYQASKKKTVVEYEKKTGMNSQ